jgi:hypothetical protein
MTRTLSVAAVHEAGHAVASVDLGVPFRGVRVHRRRPGSGINYGTGRVIHLFHISDAELWSRAVCFLTGGFAEARYRRCNAAAVLLTTASDDWRRFNEHTTALTLRLLPAVMVNAGLRSADRELEAECTELAVQMAEAFALEFVRERWSAILSVAAALDANGFLTVAEVRRIAA